ncbi:S66 peptidase family protein [Aquibacillus salsiterrae]|uniref:LD-carboxypeptidase n=1 Tax=Aquibacillus salsiterrae TaxID=2950439 RepID=A0A9X4AFY7_9BACI|nr:LD-carboxypeptidase [Aquibacillus salsiterrae]MDC3416725.1 LD-carboxypeptidase [Aquibacillus salsiterrae]
MLPKRLAKGDTVGIIAPAGPPDPDELNKGIRFLQSLGLKVKLGQHCNNVYGYLAGTDEERLYDLHDMFADPNVQAIICARGGYGTGRIAQHINYELIADNPKIFWGYSDITYLHTAIRQQTGLVTFHGPMVSSDIGGEHFDSLSKRMFEQMFEPRRIVYSEKIAPIDIITPGDARGEIVGGNLTLLVSTLGTPYELGTANKLLLLEDIGEEPNRVDAMLNQLRLAGKFDEAAGVILGNFSDGEPSGKKPSFTLQQVFHQYFSSYPKPVVSGLQIGHCLPNIAIPLGTIANLSTTTKTLTINPGVW